VSDAPALSATDLFDALPLSTSFDPRAGFLTPTSPEFDNPRPPLILDLAALNVTAGDQLSIASFGDFAYWPDDPSWDGVERNSEIIAIFSVGSTLLDTSAPNRVPGAIEARLPTGEVAPQMLEAVGYTVENDIPLSFFARDVTVVVPDGATHLFIGVPDPYYADNVDGDNDFGVRVEKAAARFPFAGFFAPVENLPAVNVARAGSTIPVKFSLGGDRGLDIFAAGAPQVVGSNECGDSAPGGTDVAMAASRAGLRYDPDAEQYVFSWNTDHAWAGTCREFVMALVDGSTHRFVVRFR
jgi:hypothetical protein